MIDLLRNAGALAALVLLALAVQARIQVWLTLRGWCYVSPAGRCSGPQGLSCERRRWHFGPHAAGRVRWRNTPVGPVYIGEDAP